MATVDRPLAIPAEDMAELQRAVDDVSDPPLKGVGLEQSRPLLTRLSEG